jgi:hypothetical protein
MWWLTYFILQWTAIQALTLTNTTITSWLPFKIDSYTATSTLVTLNGKEIYLFWKVLEGNTEIEFAVASPYGATWVGIGVSQSGGMRGASIWVGRKTQVITSLSIKTIGRICIGISLF